VRCSGLAHMDETGSKVGAQLQWLWGVETQQIAYCEILPRRGFSNSVSSGDRVPATNKYQYEGCF